MKVRHLILMLLKASGGNISSKTKVQKEMYFLSLLMNKELGFKAHYYGPYSPAVEEGLDELIGAGFVSMRRETFNIVNRGFEIQRYDFSITDAGEDLAGQLIRENADEYGKTEELVKKLKEMSNPDYLNLSIAAKTYFILKKENSPMSTEEIIKKAKNFDWNIGENDIDVAVKILQKLALVNIK